MRGLGLALCLGLCVLWADRAQADRAGLVIEAESGRVLHAEKPNLRSFPASTTKMMTLYLTFAAIEAGTLKLDEELRISERAAGQGGQSLDLRSGRTIKAREAILGVIVESANDAAVVLAERVGGSEDEFARLMTAKARELGMTRSVFRNASGLNHPEQVVTARDMAILALALLRDFPQHYGFFGARSFAFAGGTRGTVNGFLVNYPGADGIKTGFTCAAGYNLVASAVREGRRLIGVVLGETSRGQRANSIAKLMDAAYARPRGAPAPSLKEIDPAESEESDPPANGVMAEECAGIVATPGLGPNGGRAAGWAVEVFGAHLTRDSAIYAARQVQRLDLRRLRSARVVVLRKGGMGRGMFRALLAGLASQVAMASCQDLRERGVYCIVQTPQRLTAAAEQLAVLGAMVGNSRMVTPQRGKRAAMP